MGEERKKLQKRSNRECRESPHKGVGCRSRWGWGKWGVLANGQANAQQSVKGKSE